MAKPKYRVISLGEQQEATPEKSAPECLEMVFNHLAAEGYFFVGFANNYGTRPAGQEAIAVFELGDEEDLLFFRSTFKRQRSIFRQIFG